MLMDNRDAVAQRRARRIDGETLAVEPDRTGVRAPKPADDRKQRRFAGAILPHQPDDLPPVNRKRDTVVGNDGSIGLCYARQFKHRSRFPARRNFTSCSVCRAAPHSMALPERGGFWENE